MIKFYSLLAGTFGALGSLCGKLSGVIFYRSLLASNAIRAACFLCMLSFNTASLTNYVKAMQHTSTYEATVLSSATNYFLTGLFGVILFGESTGLLWWLGISTVLLGLVLIQTSNDRIKTY